MTGFVDLSSAVAVVTDAGIGRASAIALGKRGARVVVSDIDGDRAFAVADTIGSSLDAWQRIIDINLLGIVRSNLVLLPVLLGRRRGHIVKSASLAGLLPYGYDRLPYTATKHADRTGSRRRAARAGGDVDAYVFRLSEEATDDSDQ